MGGALSAPWAVFSSIKFGRDVHARIGGVDAFKRSGSWLHASGGARSSIYATGAAEGSLVGVAGRAQGRVLNGAAAKTWQSNRGLMSRVKGMQKTGLRSLFKGNGLAKGVWKNGQFLKSGSIATDIFLIAGGTVALNIAGSAIGGLAGRIADEALADSRNRRGMYYDNRYFDNRQYGYSTMQQVGMAMNNHGQNMMSVARIFHSR